MRRILLVLAALLGLFSLVGFWTYRQESAALVTLLNRSGNVTTRITDGDAVHISSMIGCDYSV